MTREDIECIIKWFSHIEQLATDWKTANGFQMPTEKILATIKVVAKDSREYVEKFCNDFVPKDLEKAAREYEQTRQDADARSDNEMVRRAYIAGAKWDREQMMKEAVEHYVIGEIAGSPVGPAIVHYDDNLTIGDKVRVIVLPKED